MFVAGKSYGHRGLPWGEDGDNSLTLSGTPNRNFVGKPILIPVKKNPKSRPQVKASQPGACRICGCTEYKRCRYLPRPGVPLGSQPLMTCKWADDSKTLCTNPVCLEKAKEELTS